MGFPFDLVGVDCRAAVAVMWQFGLSVASIALATSVTVVVSVWRLAATHRRVRREARLTERDVAEKGVPAPARVDILGSGRAGK